MNTVLASTLTKGDKVTFETKDIPGWAKAQGKVTGMIYNYISQLIREERHNYIEVITDTGIVRTYLKMTDEVTKHIISDDEKKRLLTLMNIRNLPRVVNRQGSDPEMFVVDKDGVVIPSFKFLAGKDKPDRIPENNAEMFWDGYQAEFNIPATSCLESSMIHFWYGLKHLNKKAKAYDKDARLTIQSTLDIPPHMLREDKDEHVAFGCMPSLNVYNMSGRKEDGRNVPFRSAGGHIHLQLTETQKKRIPEYVKALDAILGVTCVSLFGGHDDPRRRELYGLAGEYRTPPHGLEYRPLSNMWLCHPTITYIVFEMARKVISLVDSGLFKEWRAAEQDTIAAINDCNVPLAQELIKQNEEIYKAFLMSFCYQKEEKVKAVFNMIMFGVDNYVDNVEAIEENWRLNGSVDSYTPSIANIENRPNYKKLLELKV